MAGQKERARDEGEPPLANSSGKGTVRIYFNPFRYPPHIPLKIRWSGSTPGDESSVEILKPLNGDVVEMDADGFRIRKRKNEQGVVYLEEDGSVSLAHGHVPYRLALDQKGSEVGKASFWAVRFPVEQDRTDDDFRVIPEKPFRQPNPVERETEMVKFHYRLPQSTPEASSEEVGGYEEVFRQATAPEKLIPVREGRGVMEIEGGMDRYDLRHRLVYTIDGESTKDIDDAVEVRQLGENRYLLGIHIADVTEFVKEGSLRDEDAKNRGTSHYLADSVIHMLPQCLSKFWCSLNPDEDRLAVSVYAEVELTGDGFSIRGVRFAKSVIRSGARLTYGQVTKLLNGEGFDGTDPLHVSLKEAEALARVVERESSYRDIAFESGNVKYHSTPDGKVVREVLPREESDALIEMFMITANRLVGEKIADMVQAAQVDPQGIGVYRVQVAPLEKDLREYLQKLKSVGLAPRDLEYNALQQVAMEALQADPDLVESLSEEEKGAWVRSAVYRQIVRGRSIEERGLRTRLGVIDRFGYKPGRILSPAGLSASSTRSFHHSLGINRYAWFTSPIRRYPDILNHRQLKGILEKGSVNPSSVDVSEVSHRLKNAKYAENGLHRRLLLYYLCHREGLQQCRSLDVVISSFQWLDPRNFILEGIWKEEYPLVFSFRRKVYARIGDYGLSCRLGKRDFHVGEAVTIQIPHPLKDISPHRGTVLIDLNDIRKKKPGRS